MPALSSTRSDPYLFHPARGPGDFPPGPRAFSGAPMHSMRSLVRLGQRLQDAWHKRSKLREESEYQWNYLTEAWAQLLAARKQLQRAEDRGFTHCLPTVLEDYRWR